jgi:hypothetical protein
VVIGDDDVEPSLPGLRDLRNGSNPAVDGDDEPAALVGESLERRRGDPVPLLEP